MTAGRFDMPLVGKPSSVTFPHVERRMFGNGMRAWSIEQSAVPAVTVSCLLEAGTAIDPPAKHGLASLTAAVVAEGAGQYDAIALSDVLARIGGHLATEVSTDVATVSLTVLARHFEQGVSILADIVRRPTLLAPDFDRVRDLRLSRLKQLARTPATAADRVLLQAVYGNHPYGHGSLGATRSVQAMTVDDVRDCWMAGWQPSTGALMVAGDIDHERALASCEAAFGDWTTSAPAPAAIVAPDAAVTRDIRVVNWPGAAQSEIRVGHAGPPRRTPDFHALVALNAILGGQFTSRINRNLREARAITYGARTSFDMRRAGGLFSCDSSVQTDATAVALAEVVREMREISMEGAISAAELEDARAALTRGYVRYFETAGQLARAMTELAAYGLPDDTYDRFVPEIGRLTPADLTKAALTALRPDETSMVVTGDLDKIGDQLQALDRPVVEVVPEF